MYLLHRLICTISLKEVVDFRNDIRQKHVQLSWMRIHVGYNSFDDQSLLFNSYISKIYGDRPSPSCSLHFTLSDVSDDTKPNLIFRVGWTKKSQFFFW